MSPDELANQNHGRVRELILRAASLVYPNPLDSERLRFTLADLGYPMDQKDLAFYLAYLREYGCLKIDEKPLFKITLVTITVKGIDVLDGRNRDCSIGIGETH